MVDKLDIRENTKKIRKENTTVLFWNITGMPSSVMDIKRLNKKHKIIAHFDNLLKISLIMRFFTNFKLNGKGRKEQKKSNKEQNKQEKVRYMHGKLKKRQSHRKYLKMRVPHQFATCAANKNRTKQTKQNKTKHTN